MLLKGIQSIKHVFKDLSHHGELLWNRLEEYYNVNYEKVVITQVI